MSRIRRTKRIGKVHITTNPSGHTNPSGGSYTCSGRIAALLELGAGFNHEFTGRENVFLNASILGLSRRETEECYDQIADFAEIGDFIDQPVKTYSSGMYVRLAFSVAIHVKPELLIVDEALSVGDAAFQHKCLRKITELRDSGMSILFVTHDTAAVKKFCNRAGWIHEGKLITLGDAVETINAYDDFLRERMKISDDEIPQMQAIDPVTVEKEATDAKLNGNETESPTADIAPQETANSKLKAEIVKAELLNSHGASTDNFIMGTTMRVKITYKVHSTPSDGFIIGAAVFRNDNLYVCGLNTGLDRYKPETSVGTHEIILTYPELPLLAGSYYFKMGIMDSYGIIRWDFYERICPFTVSCQYVAEGVFVLEHNWSSN